MSGVSSTYVFAFDESTVTETEQVLLDVGKLLEGLEDATASRTHFGDGEVERPTDEEVSDDALSQMDVPVEAIVQWCDLPYTVMEKNLESVKLYVRTAVSGIVGGLPVDETQSPLGASGKPSLHEKFPASLDALVKLVRALNGGDSAESGRRHDDRETAVRAQVLQMLYQNSPRLSSFQELNSISLSASAAPERMYKFFSTIGVSFSNSYSRAVMVRAVTVLKLVKAHDCLRNVPWLFAVDNAEYMYWTRTLQGSLSKVHTLNDTLRAQLEAQEKQRAGQEHLLSFCNCKTGCDSGRCACIQAVPAQACHPHTCGCSGCKNPVNHLVSHVESQVARGSDVTDISAFYSNSAEDKERQWMLKQFILQVASPVFADEDSPAEKDDDKIGLIADNSECCVLVEGDVEAVELIDTVQRHLKKFLTQCLDCAQRYDAHQEAGTLHHYTRAWSSKDGKVLVSLQRLCAQFPEEMKGESVARVVDKIRTVSSISQILDGDLRHLLEAVCGTAPPRLASRESLLKLCKGMLGSNPIEKFEECRATLWTEETIAKVTSSWPSAAKCVRGKGVDLRDVLRSGGYSAIQLLQEEKESNTPDAQILLQRTRLVFSHVFETLESGVRLSSSFGRQRGNTGAMAVIVAIAKAFTQHIAWSEARTRPAASRADSNSRASSHSTIPVRGACPALARSSFQRDSIRLPLIISSAEPLSAGKFQDVGQAVGHLAAHVDQMDLMIPIIEDNGMELTSRPVTINRVPAHAFSMDQTAPQHPGVKIIFVQGVVNEEGEDTIPELSNPSDAAPPQKARRLSSKRPQEHVTSSVMAQAQALAHQSQADAHVPDVEWRTKWCGAWSCNGKCSVEQCTGIPSLQILRAASQIPGAWEQHVSEVYGSIQVALEGTRKNLGTPDFFEFAVGSRASIRPTWVNERRKTHGFELDGMDTPNFVALFCADQAIHQFVQERVAKGELTMTLQTCDGLHLAFAGMNSVCSRFVNVLKLRDVFEKILNLKKDRTDPVMMISQGHLELTFQSHLMVAYALVADIFKKVPLEKSSSVETCIEYLNNEAERHGGWGLTPQSRLMWIKLKYAREVVAMQGLIQGTRDGKHQLVLASLKEIKVLMACDSSHHKKQAHLTGLLLDLESTSRRVRDLAIRGALTVPWRGEGVVSGRKTEDPKPYLPLVTSLSTRL